MKKYCECFQGGAVCGTNCKCKMCANFEGSQDLQLTRAALESGLPPPPIRDREKDPSRRSPVTVLEVSPPLSGMTTGSSSIMKPTLQGQNIVTGVVELSPFQSSPELYATQTQSASQTQPTSAPTSAMSSPGPVPKKRRKTTAPVVAYPFFGPSAPLLPKIIALRCLEFLDNKSLYNASIVNSLWSKAAMDDALWE